MLMEIDVYDEMLKYHGNRIRVVLKGRFLNKLSSIIKSNRIELSTKERGWLFRGRSPKLLEIYDICNKASISKEMLFSSIEYFRCGRSSKRLKFQRILKIDDDISYFLGLFAGEGTKSMDGPLQINNTNRDIIKFCSKFYRINFCVEDDNIKVYVGIPGEFEVNEIERFLFSLSINPNNIHIRTENHRRKPKMAITATSVTYRIIIDCMMKYLPKIIADNKLGISFLRGLVDGEGCVSKSGNRMIFAIAMNDSKYLDMAEFVLKKYGCRTRREIPTNKKSANDMLILHARDFNNLIKLKIFRFRTDDFEKLIRFNRLVKERHSVRDHMLEEFMLSMNRLKETGILLNTKNVSRYLKLSSSHTNFLCKNLEERGFLLRSRESVSSHYKYKLTTEGATFINKRKQVENNKLLKLQINIGV